MSNVHNTTEKWEKDGRILRSRIDSRLDGGEDIWCENVKKILYTQIEVDLLSMSRLYPDLKKEASYKSILKKLLETKEFKCSGITHTNYKEMGDTFTGILSDFENLRLTVLGSLGEKEGDLTKRLFMDDPMLTRDAGLIKESYEELLKNISFPPAYPVIGGVLITLASRLKRSGADSGLITVTEEYANNAYGKGTAQVSEEYLNNIRNYVAGRLVPYMQRIGMM